MDALQLNLHIYTPTISAARYHALYGDIPQPDTPQHDDFSKMVKLQPFNHAMDLWKPDIWLNGIRSGQNTFRKNLDIFTFGSHKTIRVAPMFHLSEKDVAQYVSDHKLTDNYDYFDPTKVEEHRECGLLKQYD